MKQSAMAQTVRRTVNPGEPRLTCTRMRLHLPRRRARDELRTLMLGDFIDDVDISGSAATIPGIARQV